MTEIAYAYQFTASIEEARKIEDSRLRLLVLADKIWKASAFAEKGQKLALAAELDAYGLMSLNMIGKIVRLAPSTLSRALPKRERTGGRFAPESLRPLVVLRRQRLAAEPISNSTIETSMEAGTSGAVAARLTGIPDWRFYPRSTS